MAGPIDLKLQVFKSEARKSALRAFDAAQSAYGGCGLRPLQISVEPISVDAVRMAANWGECGSMYPWADALRWKSRDRRGFDISIWAGTELCGLCYATPRASAICMKIVLLEGQPDQNHPLKGRVMALALAAVDAYARMMGCSTIQIQEPAPGAVPCYLKSGFYYDQAGRLVLLLDEA
jgi:hypothetical protein